VGVSFASALSLPLSPSVGPLWAPSPWPPPPLSPSHYARALISHPGGGLWCEMGAGSSLVEGSVGCRAPQAAPWGVRLVDGAGVDGYPPLLEEGRLSLAFSSHSPPFCSPKGGSIGKHVQCSPAICLYCFPFNNTEVTISHPTLHPANGGRL
jgi:hypothetical protein